MTSVFFDLSRNLNSRVTIKYLKNIKIRKLHEKNKNERHDLRKVGVKMGQFI